jgi:hypothetical protein
MKTRKFFSFGFVLVLLVISQAPSTQASSLTFSVDIENISATLQNVSTGSVLSPNSTSTAISVFGSASGYNTYETLGQVVTGGTSASYTYPGGTYVTQASGSSAYNLTTNTGSFTSQVSLESAPYQTYLSHNYPGLVGGGTDTGFNPPTYSNNYTFLFNFHVSDAGTYILNMGSWDYIYNAQFTQSNQNPVGFVYFNSPVFSLTKGSPLDKNLIWIQGTPFPVSDINTGGVSGTYSPPQGIPVTLEAGDYQYGLGLHLTCGMYSLKPPDIPLPSTFWLLGSGLFALWGWRRKLK